MKLHKSIDQMSQSQTDSKSVPRVLVANGSTASVIRATVAGFLLEGPSEHTLTIRNVKCAVMRSTTGQRHFRLTCLNGGGKFTFRSSEAAAQFLYMIISPSRGSKMAEFTIDCLHGSYKMTTDVFADDIDMGYEKLLDWLADIVPT
jgi:hypothetical protein